MADQPKNKKEAHKVSRAIGASIGWTIGKTFKVAYVLGKPVVKGAGSITAKGAKAAANAGQRHIDKQWTLIDEPSATNFYKKAAMTCEATVDALLNQKDGTAERIVRGLAAKLGIAGATAGIFSIASIFGTASTGTAISSLSGAAFNSAALKWIGGSMAVGGPIVALVGLIGGGLAYFFTRMFLRKFTGKKRNAKKLDDQESNVINTLMLLATSFRQQSAPQRHLDPISASVLHRDVFAALSDELELSIEKVSDWPPMPLSKLRKQIDRIRNLNQYLQDFAASAGYRPGMVGVPRRTDAISTTILKLLSKHTPPLDGEEQRAFDAIRLTDRTLADASTEMVRDFVWSLRISRVRGFTNKARRIYRDMNAEIETSPASQIYVVTIYQQPDHAGAEVALQNSQTGEEVTVSLSGEKYAAFVKEHNEASGDVSLFSNGEGSEIAAVSSVNSHGELEGDGSSGVQPREGADFVESMGVAGMINLARNAQTLLRGNSMSKKRKKQLIQDGVATASVAGLTQLIL